MNVAIIGCGLIGRKRAKSLAPCQVVLGVDVVAERAAQLAAEFGAQHSNNWRDAIGRKDIGMLLVSATHNMLAEITLAAARAGQHVLVEKPGACRAHEIDPILAACESTGALVRVGFNHRYHPALLKAREIADSGVLGPLMFVRGRYGHGGRLGYEKEWRAQPELSGGGELIDQGVHLIDLARLFLGDFVSVQGFAHTYFWNMPVEDNGFLLLKTAEDQTAFLHASCSEWKNMFSFEIYGRTGKLEINGLGGSYGVEKLTHYQMLPEMGPPETTSWEYPRGDRSWEIEIKEFLEDIRLARTPAAGLLDAQRALEVVEEVYRQSDILQERAPWAHTVDGPADKAQRSSGSTEETNMIITRSPLRISLGGGGTDLPSYYQEHSGFLIAAAIDKYVYITLHRTFVQELIIKYSKLERVNSLDEIEHPIIRESLKLLDTDFRRLEITSMADIPSGTGLGSSGSFTTALLRALHALKKNPIQTRELAEQACHVELDRLHEPIGKQDQYIAAFGGLTCFRFNPNGYVDATPLKIPQDALYNLEDSLLLFFTGYSRSAASTLKEQDSKTKTNDREMVDNLHFVKQLGRESQEALETGDLRKFADLMNIHWEHKKKRSQKMSNDKIDEWYYLALKNGALGGKLIGAGGGGFLMFYTEDRVRLRQAMHSAGLEEVRFRFDFEGTRVVNAV